MNKSGKQQLNNEAVRKLVSHKQQLNDNEYIIVDAKKNIISVNIKTGETFRLGDMGWIACNTGYTSSKQNGYVYTELWLDINDKLTKVNYGTHSLVAMIAYTFEYDCLVDNDITPVVNHKDNCPWNNKSENLEWTTQPLNVLHGKLVASIEKADSVHDWLTLFSGVKFISYEQNLSDKNFVTLTTPLSVQTIQAYLQGKKAKDFWGLKDNKELLQPYQVLEFCNWWIKRNNITKTA